MQKAGVDLVQIQPFLVLISFINHVILLLASIFHAQFSQEIKEDLYQNNVNLNQACVTGGFLLFCMFFCGSSSKGFSRAKPEPRTKKKPQFSFRVAVTLTSRTTEEKTQQKPPYLPLLRLTSITSYHHFSQRLGR